jgi:hypothetical protein
VKRGGGSGFTKSSIFNPKTKKVTAMTVSNTKHDMFCPGIAYLPSGDIVVTGGQNADRVSIYDVSGGAWKTAPTMSISRGYGSTVALSSGKVRKGSSEAHNSCCSCRFSVQACRIRQAEERQAACLASCHCSLPIAQLESISTGRGQASGIRQRRGMTCISQVLRSVLLSPFSWRTAQTAGMITPVPWLVLDSR